MTLPDLNPTTTILSIAVVGLVFMNVGSNKAYDIYKESVQQEIDSINLLYKDSKEKIKIQQQQLDFYKAELAAVDSTIVKDHEDYEEFKNSNPELTLDDLRAYIDSTGQPGDFCRHNPHLCD